MREFLKQLSEFGSASMEEVGLSMFLVAMAFSLATSFFISYLYVVFFRSRTTGSQIHRAFPLLGVAITGVFITIQFSLPLSLGLLGALSIVRFRTPIKEPEEISFVMIVVATSLCCATFNILFLGVILSAAVIALLTMRRIYGFRIGASGHGLLVVSMGSDSYRKHGEPVIGYLTSTLDGGALDSITEGPEGASISFHFVAVQPQETQAISAGLKQLTADAATNFYFDRDGA
ncbi:MAG: DUF4956 domain-containing protein [Planctomycetota bacterium]|nr:DUF4956 domain-containing protein [Planctomycetota bacterium]MDG2142710.1 DUF4956 domain-containing protein [Planctomycetota bacterium]